MKDEKDKDRFNEKILLEQEIYERDVINNPDCVFDEISIDDNILEKSIDTILKKASERKYDDELREADSTFHNFEIKSILVSGSNLNKLKIIRDILEEMLPFIPKSEGIIFHDNLSRVMTYLFPLRIERDLPIDYDMVNLKLDKDVEQYLNDYSKILGLYDIEIDFNLQDWLFEDCLTIKNTFSILDKDNIDLSFECHNYISEKEFLGFDVKEEFFISSSNSNDNVYGYFFNNGLINSVYYVDNVSIFELNPKKPFFHNLFHVNEITEDLFGFKFGGDDDDKLNQNVKIILEKIERIIQGKYKYSGGRFETDKIDNVDKNISNSSLDKSDSQRNISTWNFNTPSGIKQIGTIQLLLLKNKLKKDGYLIIDEPEVNLHPDWQFKFAEILVLLAKDLNITIYLNSHSPFFIEAMDAFTEFYDMENEINYYLAEESENKGKYDFNKLGSDELFKIYDNLGRPYDLIDQLRLQKHLGE